MSIELVGVEELQGALASLPAEVEDIVYSLPGQLLAAVQRLTPVDSGAMRRAWAVKGAMLHIDPAATNPRTGKPVADYAEYVSDRVGILDVVEGQFARAVEEEARKHGYV